MSAHFEFLVEEPSMEAFLVAILPRLLGTEVTFTIHVHQGKSDLLRKLASRLRAYAKWLPGSVGVVVLVDRDDDDCRVLKQRLERDAAGACMPTRTTHGGLDWKVLNRIAVEELEAWFFGEWTSVQRAYPQVPAGVARKAAHRDPDEIAGGTWEALERALKQGGYFKAGLRKKEAAQEIGKHFDPELCTSPSFIVFRGALLEAIG